MPSRSSKEFLSRTGIVPVTGRPAARLSVDSLLLATLPAEQPTVDLIRSLDLTIGQHAKTTPYPTAEVTQDVDAVTS